MEKEIMKYLTVKEILELISASLIISFIISYSDLKSMISLEFLTWFLITLPIVMLGFVLHEMAHKYAALHYGMFARFEISPQGLLFSLILKILIGVTIIIPGAVMIYKYFRHRSSKKERAIEGIISYVGPLTNFVIGTISLVLLFFIEPQTMLFKIAYICSYLNLLLAVFNMLPIPPLDGFKILRWSIPLYGITFALYLMLLLFLIL